MKRLDYDRYAATYDRRYEVNPLAGIAQALSALAAEVTPQRILEVGCGTGRWLPGFGDSPLTVGVDASMGMLQQAFAKGSRHIAAARANQLPFAAGQFDLIYCVNAIHHFDDPKQFIADAKELLTPKGCLGIIGIDPRVITDWFCTITSKERATPTWLAICLSGPLSMP